MAMNGITSPAAELLYQRSDRRWTDRQTDEQAVNGVEDQAARTGQIGQAAQGGQAVQAGQAARTGAVGTDAANASEGAETGVDPRRFDTYEPANPEKPTYKVDMDTVQRMKEETENRMVELVQQSLSRQLTGGRTSRLFEMLKGGRWTTEDVEQAKKDVAEDGYWGVEQTSDRLVKMAQALSGGDPEKLEKMEKAFEKGYKQAEKAMGGKLPGISERTREATLNKFQALREENQKIQNQQEQNDKDRTEQAQRVQNVTPRDRTRPAAAAAVGLA